MARVKFSGLVSEISGSIGGATFSRNNYGYSLKTKNLGSFPQTFFSQRMRAGIQRSIQSWKLLTDQERSNYNAYAKTFPVYSTHDSKVPLSGYHLFLRYHFYLNLIFPGILISFDFAKPDKPNVSLTLTRSGSALTMSIVYDTTDSDLFTLFFASPGVKNADYSVNRRYKLVTWRYNTNSTADRAAGWEQRWGKVPESGQYVYFKIVYFSVISPYIFQPVYQIIPVN